MKITDLALIFIAIMLPIILIVYINVAFVVKAEKEEMYYKNLMNTAINDGVNAMKEVENEDTDIDYGYSGIADKKVSINAMSGVRAFYKSLFNNFNIAGNEGLENDFKNYIPAIAVVDYNGIYIYSAEKTKNIGGDAIITWTLKPKTYFTTKYCIIDLGLVANPRYTFKNFDLVKDSDTKVNNLIYEVTLSMDDYVVLNVLKIDDITKKIKPLNSQESSFYLNDDNNNEILVQGVLSTEEVKLKKEIIEYLTEVKKTVIAHTVSKEITYAINAHNKIARDVGITYNFYSPYSEDGDANDIYDNINGIGMVAFIQGISLGNRKLNYKAYSVSNLSLTKKYYLSTTELDNRPEGPVTYKDKRLYHNSDKCPIYQQYLATHPNESNRYNPSYLLKKEEAATLGFYPCPICKP